jgi:hypothetical protein
MRADGRTNAGQNRRQETQTMADETTPADPADYEERQKARQAVDELRNDDNNDEIEPDPAAGEAAEAAEDAKVLLTGNECEAMCIGLLRVLKNLDAQHPKELHDLVDAAIEYLTAIDESEGCETIGLAELIDTRAKIA